LFALELAGNGDESVLCPALMLVRHVLQRTLHVFVCVSEKCFCCRRRVIFQDSKHVHFTRELPLDAFCSPELNRKGSHTGTLVAVVVHIGSTTSTGHYFAYVGLYVGLERCEGSGSSMWISFERSYTTPLTACCFHCCSFVCYTLFI